MTGTVTLWCGREPQQTFRPSLNFLTAVAYYTLTRRSQNNQQATITLTETLWKGIACITSKKP